MKKFIIIMFLILGSGGTSIYAQEQLNVRKEDKIKRKQDAHQEKLDAKEQKLNKKEDKEDKKQRKMDKKVRKTHAVQRSIDRQSGNDNIPK